MSKRTDYAQKMALDMRMIDPVRFSDEREQNNKLAECARSLYEYYSRYDEVKETTDEKTQSANIQA